MSEFSGPGFIKYVAALGGFWAGWGIGAAVASNWAVPTDSFLGRTAEAGAPLGGVLLQFGLGTALALMAFVMVRAVVDR